MNNRPPLILLVLGHSDAFGSALADSSQAWPQIVSRELPALIDRPVELCLRRMMVIRPDGGQRIESLLDECEPDLAIFCTNPFGFAVETVSNRIRQRFGTRVAGAYQRASHALDSWTMQGRFGIAALNNGTRRLVRRVVGTAPASSFEEVMEATEEVLRVLARREGTQVMVQGGNRLSTWLQGEDPSLTERVEAMREATEAFCREHHFTWFNTEQALLPGRREDSYLPDGIHRNPEAHRHFADLVLPVLAGMVEEGARV